MSKKKKTDVEPTAEEAAQAALDAAKQHEQQQSPSETISVTNDAMMGNLRDIMLELFKHRRKSWQEMSQEEQEEAVNMIETSLDKAIEEAVTIIAADNRAEIVATLDSITLKDGIKISCKIGKHHENRHELFDAAGGTVLLVLTNSGKFKGQDAAAVIDADEPHLPLDDESSDDAQQPGEGENNEPGEE